MNKEVNNIKNSLLEFSKISEFETIIDVLCFRAKNHPDKIAYIYSKDGETEEDSITYKDLDSVAKSIACLLEKNNLKGKRVLLLYQPNGLEFIKAFLGCLYSGVIAVPAYLPEFNRLEQNLNRLKMVILDAQIEVVLTTTNILGTINSLFKEINVIGFEQIIWLNSDNIEISEKWTKPDVNKDYLAFLQYTSGSTAKPKGVMISHGNLIYNEKMIEQAFEYDENKKDFVCWVPFYHDLGLIGHLLQSLYIGSKTIILSPIDFLKDPFRWFKLVSKYKVSMTGAPNFAYDLCIRKISQKQRKNIDLSQLSCVANAAEPIRYQTIKNFSEYFEISGFREEMFNPIYGLAEATAFVSSCTKVNRIITCNVKQSELEKNKIVLSSNNKDSVILVSSGKTWLDQKIKIVNPITLIECNENEIGEIWLSGGNISKGYWNNPEETKKTFQAFLENSDFNPFLRTGDLGFIRDQNLFVTGRIKDMIKINGRSIYPQDLELTVELNYKDFPEIRLGCTASFSIEINSEEKIIVMLEVDIKKNSNFNENNLIDKIRKKIFEENNVFVYGIILADVGSIPKTSSGKIMRNASKYLFLSNFKESSFKIIAKSFLNLKHQEQSLNKNSLKLSKEELINWILKWFMIEQGIYEMDITKPFVNYGIDSITGLIFLGSLEKILNIEIPSYILIEFDSIEKLINLLFSSDFSKNAYYNKQINFTDIKVIDNIDSETLRNICYLRKIAYGKNNPIVSQLNTEDFVDKFDEKSKHFIFIDKNKIVASARAIFNNGIETNSEIIGKYKIKIKKDILSNPYIEFSRLCILPDYKKSDLFVNLINQLIYTAIKTNHNYIICTCEKKLLKSYINMGFKEIAEPFEFKEHKTILYPLIVSVKELLKNNFTKDLRRFINFEL